MWKMYASMESGVRIGLPKNPFKRYPEQATVKETGEYFIGTFDTSGQPYQGTWYGNDGKKIEEVNN